MRYVEKLRPVAFLMENVQGMLWTRDAKRDLAVVDVIEAGTRPVAADFLSIESKARRNDAARVSVRGAGQTFVICVSGSKPIPSPMERAQ